MRIWPFLVLSVFCLWPHPTFAQTRHVEVVNRADREVERTAHHLGMTAAELRETRRLLREATDLILTEELDSTWEFVGLMGLWRRVHPTEAIAAMETIIEELKELASETPDAAIYGWALTAARSVVAETLSGEQRETFLAEWPERPELGDPAAAQLEEARAAAERERWSQLVRQDPLATAQAMLRGNGPVSLQLAAQLAGRLRYTGESETALELIEAALRGLQSGLYDREDGVWNFMNQVAYLYPDRFAEVVEIIHSRPFINTPFNNSGEMLLRNDHGETLLTPEESRLLRLLRVGSHHPELAAQAARQFPAFHSKLANLGGVERALRAEVVTWSKDGEAQVWNPSRYDREQFHYNWGDASLRPADMRRRLKTAFSAESDLPMFLSTARQFCAGDPDFSRIALALLRARVFQIEEAERRVHALAQFVQVVQGCEGAVDTALLEKGFKELEAFQKSAASQDADKKSLPPTAKRLEAALLAALSGAQFEDAVERIRAVDPSSDRMRLLLAVVQSRLERY